MNRISHDEISAVVQASPAPPTKLWIDSVCTDTREMKPGSLFVAITGETHDGHEHLAAAKSGGAVAALVHRAPAELPPDFPVILVDNTRLAMGRLARHVRESFAGTVIAVGGSNGKTGTKGLIHAALRPPLRGSASPKSFNNDIGVPLTMFAASSTDDYLVLELGTNHPGEIATLGKIARPDIAVITNVGAEHLEFFRDLDGVRHEEAALVDGLNDDAILVVNGDDAGLLEAVGGFRGRRVTFGWNSSNDLRPTDVRCTTAGTRFQLGDAEFFVPQLGRHTAANATAAIAVARTLKLGDEQIAANLATAAGAPMRLQVERVGDGITLINDVYNANPHSMRAALETLRDLPTEGRRIAVLGDMRELGDTAAVHHAELGRFAGECNLDAIYCVGPQAKQIAAAAAGSGVEITLFDTAADAGAVVRKKLRAGDLVLLKASRGVKLEMVAQAIADGGT